MGLAQVPEVRWRRRVGFFLSFIERAICHCVVVRTPKGLLRYPLSLSVFQQVLLVLFFITCNYQGTDATTYLKKGGAKNLRATWCVPVPSVPFCTV